MDMSTKLASKRLLCINCNVRVNKLRRHLVLELDTGVISLISTLISPVIITEEDYICKKCLRNSLQAINSQLNKNNDAFDISSRFQHGNVCLVCGRSLHNCASNLILKRNASDLIVTMINFIKDAVAPHQISQSDRICHPCWLKFKKQAVCSQPSDASLSIQTHAVKDEIVESYMDVTYAPTVHIPHHKTPKNEHKRDEIEPPLELTQVIRTASQPQSNTQNITLLNYRRAPNTASHCVFYKCDNIFELRVISDPLRATLLSTYKYYIPKLAKVCSEHLRRNSWDSLYDSANSITNFTLQQVEHIFSFVNTFKSSLDFTSKESVYQIDDHLFEFWIGVSKENFITVLEELPRVERTHRGILGLAALLIKIHTGDTDQRIATLLEVPRSTLERLMNSVKKIISQDFDRDKSHLIFNIDPLS